jgi:hypothetical protein
MIKILLETEQYSGKYVALESFQEHKVIAYGVEPEVIYNEAVNRGCINPVIVYVPEKGTVQIS